MNSQNNSSYEVELRDPKLVNGVIMYTLRLIDK